MKFKFFHEITVCIQEKFLVILTCCEGRIEHVQGMNPACGLCIPDLFNHNLFLYPKTNGEDGPHVKCFEEELFLTVAADCRSFDAVIAHVAVDVTSWNSGTTLVFTPDWFHGTSALMQLCIRKQENQLSVADQCH